MTTPYPHRLDTVSTPEVPGEIGCCHTETETETETELLACARIPTLSIISTSLGFEKGYVRGNKQLWQRCDTLNGRQSKRQ